jgi:GTP-binding protein
MVHGYLQGRSTLNGVVWLLDVRRDPSDEDLEFLDWLEESNIPTIPVVTKVDKVSRNELARRMAKIAERTGLSAELFTPFSVLNRQGSDQLWELISLALQA